MIDIDEAEDMVSQMEVEIQGMPQSIRSQYTARVKASKAELTRWRNTAVCLRA
jgi:vesicle transport through interaction with t-SNAREs protein 1